MSDPTTRPSPMPSSLAEEAAKPSVYRPLSLLALVAIGIGGLYAAVVVLGGLVAFFRGDPLLLPWWTFPFPIAGAGLSFAALKRIQRSEGTLAGEKLARWGLLLSALVGLGYMTYLATTY